MSEGQKGIKEISEFLAGVRLLGVDAKKVLADKKVNLADLPVAMDLLQHSDAIVQAAVGADQIPAEVKDLSAEEAQQVLAELFDVMKSIREA